MRRSRGALPRARSGGEWSVVSDEPQQQPASGSGRRRAARRPSTGPRAPVARRRPTPDAHTPHVAARRSRLAEARRAVVVPTIAYPEELPVSARRADIAAAIRDHQVVIVAGETGSGKTTQIPKILLELGRGRDGQIGHTQPRRIAASTVAERINEELSGDRAAAVGALGSIVGYQVRFTDQSSEQTLVKVMTDGILLAQIQRDPRLLAYDTLIIDEAHERSLNIDFILGYLTRLLPQRPDLKVVITSATIDSERFARHFGGPPTADAPDGVPAPVVQVTGRTYPVEIRYQPLVADREDPSAGPDQDPDPDLSPAEWSDSRAECSTLRRPRAECSTLGRGRGARGRGAQGRPQGPGANARAGDRDVMTAICEAVDELCAEGPGDILVFLSGEREIRDAEDALRSHLGPRVTDAHHPRAVELLPLYARLSSAEQHRVFARHTTRRVILATNVAETSLTVPGVRYVVDPGTARISRWSKATKVQRPARWLAEAWLTGSIGSRCTLVALDQREIRAVPGSTTYRTPGTVSEVSATLVARMTRRVVCRANTRCCSADDSRAYSGSSSTARGWWASVTRGPRWLRRASSASRISRSPERNTRMSPGPSAHSSSTASQMAVITSRSSAGALAPCPCGGRPCLPRPRPEVERSGTTRPRVVAGTLHSAVEGSSGSAGPAPGSSESATSGWYRTSTGYVRPVTSTTGAGTPSGASAVGGPPKCRANRSESIVAEVMTTFRSGRCGSRRVR